MGEDGHLDDALTTPDAWSDRWASLRLPHRVDVRSHAGKCFDQLFRDVLPRGKRRFLEVGSGPCAWLAYFEQVFGYDSYGIDNALGGCVVGRRNLELQHLTPRVVCGDLRQPPFASGSFDVVLSAGVIEHFEDLRPPLEAIADLVGAGGRLVTTVPNMGGWVGTLRRITDARLYATHKAVSATDLEGAYDSLGFESVRTGYFGSLRVPDYLAAYRRSRLPHQRMAWAASRAADRALTGFYRTTGFSIDSSWLSYHVYAVGRRPT